MEEKIINLIFLLDNENDNKLIELLHDKLNTIITEKEKLKNYHYKYSWDKLPKVKKTQTFAGIDKVLQICEDPTFDNEGYPCNNCEFYSEKEDDNYAYKRPVCRKYDKDGELDGWMVCEKYAKYEKERKESYERIFKINEENKKIVRQLPVEMLFNKALINIVRAKLEKFKKEKKHETS